MNEAKQHQHIDPGKIADALGPPPTKQPDLPQCKPWECHYPQRRGLWRMVAQAVTSQSNGTIKAWDIMTRVGMPLLGIVLTAVIAYLTAQSTFMHDIDRRVTTIESNRFTVLDGQLLSKDIEAVRLIVSSGVPPAWFKQQVDRIASKQEDIVTRLTRIEAELMK